ncbi:cilia- and flagella-associated protein 263 [Xylocopa sonorina]|uniref:cilia- and flagella-associated protein 263 n=1 Tax=Xylocopa sonorina TaxID=1818115 RepID=UPI00403AC8CC
MSLRESIISIGSRMMQRHEDDINFDVMTLEELQEMQNDLLQKIWMITLENDVYERYLTRQEPKSLNSKTQLLDRARLTRRMTQHMLPRLSRMSFRESVLSLHDLGRHSITSTPSLASIPSASRFGTPSLMTIGTITDSPKITMAHRMVMAKKELEELKKKLERLEQYSRKRKTIMRAEIEEIEIRINEVQEAKIEFEKEVVTEGVDPITGKIPAERVIRFVEEWLRSANTIIERLRLRSATARMQIAKAGRQLVQREELGESLHAIDFEKLNIENQDYVKMLEEKSVYVIDMKRITGSVLDLGLFIVLVTGHYHLKLTQHKQKLNDLALALSKVKEDILSKQAQIKEFAGEHNVMEINVRRLEKQLKDLLNFMEYHTAPDILDFVKVREEYSRLERIFKLLQRRVNIEKIMHQEYKTQTQGKKKPAATDEAKREA